MTVTALCDISIAWSNINIPVETFTFGVDSTKQITIQKPIILGCNPSVSYKLLQLTGPDGTLLSYNYMSINASGKDVILTIDRILKFKESKFPSTTTWPVTYIFTLEAKESSKNIMQDLKFNVKFDYSCATAHTKINLAAINVRYYVVNENYGITDKVGLVRSFEQ